MPANSKYIVIPDANVCLAYAVNYKYRKTDKKTVHVRAPYSEAVVYYLTPEISKGSIYVIRAVELETQRMMYQVLRGAVRKAGLLVRTTKSLMAPSLSRFHNLYDVIYPSYYELIPDVCMFYIDIWKDPAKDSKKRTWESIKKRQLKDGPPTGNDLVILATAAKLAELYEVELLTFDHDFIVFSDEIKKVFNVTVVNAGTIPH
jgi:predicted nucleic acid-binding protein